MDNVDNSPCEKVGKNPAKIIYVNRYSDTIFSCWPKVTESVLSKFDNFLLTNETGYAIVNLEYMVMQVVIMLKISQKLSTTLSLSLAVFFFLCCIAGLFVLPDLTEMLINIPDNIGNRGNITQLGRTLSLVSAYCVVLDMMLADVLLFALLLRVRSGEVFTQCSVSLIRGVSWCCLGLCVPFGFLGIYFQLAWIVCLLAVFLGICLRVCKNAFEVATEIKRENDLTV